MRYQGGSMREWEVLKKDSIPEDILTGNYEFQCDKKNLYSDHDYHWFVVNEVLFELCKGKAVMYRKPEPKQPTHEDKMSKYWKEKCGIWRKVTCYSAKDGMYFIRDWVYSSWFTGRESSDMPPEAK